MQNAFSKRQVRQVVCESGLPPSQQSEFEKRLLGYGNSVHHMRKSGGMEFDAAYGDVDKAGAKVRECVGSQETREKVEKSVNAIETKAEKRALELSNAFIVSNVVTVMCTLAVILNTEDLSKMSNVEKIVSVFFVGIPGILSYALKKASNFANKAEGKANDLCTWVSRLFDDKKEKKTTSVSVEAKS